MYKICIMISDKRICMTKGYAWTRRYAYLKTSQRRKKIKDAIGTSFTWKKFVSSEFAKALTRIYESVSVLAVSRRFALWTFTKVSRAFNLNSADPSSWQKFHASSITLCAILRLCFRGNQSLLLNFLDLKITLFIWT